jgi:hypothetical protein
MSLLTAFHPTVIVISGMIPFVIPNIIHAHGGQNSVITGVQFSVVIPSNICI